jgi:hypothetical protein
MTWTINGSVEGGDLDVFAVDKTLGDYRVCMIDCDNDSVSNHDHEANALLIAAAPDLLAALEDAVAALADANYYPSELNRLQAVITRAKGN